MLKWEKNLTFIHIETDNKYFSGRYVNGDFQVIAMLNGLGTT